jgi:hypothetical protein
MALRGRKPSNAGDRALPGRVTTAAPWPTRRQRLSVARGQQRAVKLHAQLTVVVISYSVSKESVRDREILRLV